MQIFPEIIPAGVLDRTFASKYNRPSTIMRFKLHAVRLLLALLLAAAGGGCVSEQHGEIRGTVTRGTTATNAPAVIPIGLQFQNLDPKSVDALTGFGFSGGVIFFVHDRQKYVNNDYRLSNDAVSAVYFSESTMPQGVDAFLGEPVAKRDETEGVHRLQGLFNVDKWKSNIGFRIRLAMQSSETNPVVVNGVLTTYDSWGFHPIQAIGLILASMGLGGE